MNGQSLGRALIAGVAALSIVVDGLVLADGHMAVSVLIGVLFGVLPAYRSARLTPEEALRRE